jgi:5-methylcytosine-specific restriction endonuclease McrA
MYIQVLVLLTLLVVLVFNVLYLNHVKTNSLYLDRARKTNQDWVIVSIKNKHRVANFYSNKKTFENANINYLTKLHLKENVNYYDQQINNANTNRIRLDGYKKTFDKLIQEHKESQPRNIKGVRTSFLFKFYERLILKSARLKPITSFTMYSFARYTSAKGRVSEKKWIDYTFDNLLGLFKEAKNEIAYEQSRIGRMKEERSKLSTSLRYEILKRDKFSCKLCGRNKNDGVKLHVDHIFPIAKGGRTDPSNLRTLCDQCNLGKKDKLELV